MYAIVNRRRMNAARAQETIELLTSGLFPKLQQAAGFVSFSLVQGEDGGNIAIILFEDKAHADAFQEEGMRWARKLDEFGHQMESSQTGEVVQHITPGS